MHLPPGIIGSRWSGEALSGGKRAERADQRGCGANNGKYFSKYMKIYVTNGVYFYTTWSLLWY